MMKHSEEKNNNNNFPFPKRIEIELSNNCNLACSFCPRRYTADHSGFMKFELFKKIIDEAENYPETIITLHRRGESLLHPEFIKICGYIKNKFNEIQIATNGTQLTKKNITALFDAVTFVSFSIDVPRLFNKLRAPADYRLVEKNILKLLELNNKSIKTQVSMVKTDLHTKDDYNFFIESWENKVDTVRIYEQHSSDGNFGSLKNKRNERKPCIMPFYEMLVYYDGTLGRCNHDWNSNNIGDLNKNSISEIWNNKFYQSLRKQHLDLKITDNVCKNCDSWYAEEKKQGTGETINKKGNL